jgi:hypothetical protein
MVNGKENQEKMAFARKHNPSPKTLQLGDNDLFLNYLRECKEQVHYPYYGIDYYGMIRCHCTGNPPALWLSEKGWLKCTKKSRKERKCFLFIPAVTLESN